MNFFKPKFWDKTNISFFSVLLIPIALTLKIKSSKPPIKISRNSGKNKATTSMRIACIESVRLTAQNPPINV